MSGGSKLLAWWQLLRAGNVFTAISNVIASYVIAQEDWQPLGPLLLLVATSAMLYEAGMVLNDVFDAKLDSKERPERPIPSGRIRRWHAAAVGVLLLVGGVACAFGTFIFLGSDGPPLTAIALAFLLISYNAFFKATFLGPWAMGGCRMLNVMLGTFTAVDQTRSFLESYALLVGLYTVGLTYFAREENEPGWKLSNTAGAVLVFAVTICVSLGAWKLGAEPTVVLMSWLALNLWMWRVPSWVSSAKLAPTVLRSAVGRIITGFILVDALMVFAVMGFESAVVVLSLLIPTWIASRWASMT